MRTKTENDHFLQGFALALVTLNRLYDQPSLCKTVIETTAQTLTDFKAAGCSDYDMKELRKIMRRP